MDIKEKGIITSKKKHACGGNTWEIKRTGADVKLCCTTCGRTVFMSYDEVRKITLKYQDGESINDNQIQSLGKKE